MTFSELEENLKKLKVNDRYCNLIKEYHNTPSKGYESGLYVNKNSNIWEVYYTERGIAELACIFYAECDLYEYMYCYFKRISDLDCWFGGLMRQYPQDLIKKIKRFGIPESEYSFYGGMSENCLCVEQNEIYVKQNGDRADTWEVYYSNGIEKVIHGIFFKKTPPMIFCSI